MDIAHIGKCSMESCACNMDGLCHTLAITVGLHTERNTYVNRSSKGRFEEANGVRVCLASDCRVIDRLECRAPGTVVSGYDKHADCQIFEER